MRQDTMGIRMQRHQLGHMQTICTLLHRDNHTNTPSFWFFTGRMLFLTTSQQCQNTEGTSTTHRRRRKRRQQTRFIDASSQMPVRKSFIPTNLTVTSTKHEQASDSLVVCACCRANRHSDCGFRALPSCARSYATGCVDSDSASDCVTSCACTGGLGHHSRRLRLHRHCAGTSLHAGHGTAAGRGRGRTRRGSRNDHGPGAIAGSSVHGGSPCPLQPAKRHTVGGVA